LLSTVKTDWLINAARERDGIGRIALCIRTCLAQRRSVVRTDWSWRQSAFTGQLQAELLAGFCEDGFRKSSLKKPDS
jgi:hypothetical protein